MTAAALTATLLHIDQARDGAGYTLDNVVVMPPPSPEVNSQDNDQEVMMKKDLVQPDHPFAVHARAAAALLAIFFAAVAGSSSVLAQGSSPPPQGITRPAAYDCSGVEGVALSNCRALNAAANASVLAQGSSPPPVGIARPGAYECSGVEGVALSNCRALNAAANMRAVEKATQKRDASIGLSHDCADLTGGALSSCRRLNGQDDERR